MAAKSFILKKENIVLAFYIGLTAEIVAITPTVRPAIAWMTDQKYLAVYDTDDAANAWRKISTVALPP